MQIMDTGEYEVLLGFMGIGAQELLVILLIVLVLFGARKIPELARGLGSGLREFRKAAKELESETDAKPASGGEQSSAGDQSGT